MNHHEPLFPFALHVVCWFCLAVIFFGVYFGFDPKLWKAMRLFDKKGKKNLPKCYKN